MYLPSSLHIPCHLMHLTHFLLLLLTCKNPRPRVIIQKCAQFGTHKPPHKTPQKKIIPQASGHQKDPAPAGKFSNDWEKSPAPEDLSPPPEDLNNFPTGKFSAVRSPRVEGETGQPTRRPTPPLTFGRDHDKGGECYRSQP